MPASQPIYDIRGERQLMTELWDPRLADNLNEWVRFVFPWGKAGTPLADLQGPRNWQDACLKEITEYIKTAKDHKQIFDAIPDMFKKAIASGRGIGKSAFFAWLAHWLVSSRIGASCWVTANGEPQLKTKTFPEISKWVTMSINSHWFDVAATKIEPAEWIRTAVARDLKIDPKYWYIVAQLWSEENPDAFAGAHNVYGEMYLFDEASGIPQPIWTVAQGVFTENTIDRYWLAFSNPRRNKGAFFECFHKHEAQWRPLQIDSRTVDQPPDVWKAIIATHGEDSNEARIEVYGQFPNSAANQYIPISDVENALKRPCIPDPGAPLLLGVDVARFGGDSTVLAFRKGRDAKSIPWQTYKGLDTVQVASRVADAVQKYKVDAIFVDGNGVGGGVVDQLKAWHYRVIEVQVSETPNDPDQYLNKGVEMWARMKEWLTIGTLPDDPQLQKHLTTRDYSYHPVNNKLVLQSVEKMKDQGFASPDRAMALSMTFAQPVARNDARASRVHQNRRMASNVDYDMFNSESLR
jgi:hypothetical protein